MDQHTIEMIGAIIIAVITALVGPAVLEYLKLKMSSSKNRDPVKKELEYSCIINEELEAIREELKADRCWVSLYHNGGHFLHGKRSMQKFSVMADLSEFSKIKLLLLSFLKTQPEQEARQEARQGLPRVHRVRGRDQADPAPAGPGPEPRGQVPRARGPERRPGGQDRREPRHG